MNCEAEPKIFKKMALVAHAHVNEKCTRLVSNFKFKFKGTVELCECLQRKRTLNERNLNSRKPLNEDELNAVSDEVIRCF